MQILLDSWLDLVIEGHILSFQQDHDFKVISLLTAISDKKFPPSRKLQEKRRKRVDKKGNQEFCHADENFQMNK